MENAKAISLTEVSLRYRVTKHEIIYLCEKEVIIPMVGAHGRDEQHVRTLGGEIEIVRLPSFEDRYGGLCALSVRRIRFPPVLMRLSRAARDTVFKRLSREYH